MGGLDAIVFTAGIGENTPSIRALACEGLAYMGVELDEEVNASVPRPINTTCLSKKDAPVKIYLIPTNEELVIASDTEKIVSALHK
jgi:acetate kinase